MAEKPNRQLSQRLSWQNIRALLINHYSAPLQTVFRQFRSGVIFFAVGLMTIYLANTAMEPSATQELVILGALVMVAGGFIVAMLAQVRLVISRLLQFWQKK